MEWMTALELRLDVSVEEGSSVQWFESFSFGLIIAFSVVVGILHTDNEPFSTS